MINKEIGIAVFQHNTCRNYIPTLTKIIDRIKPDNKQKCKLYILTSGQPHIPIHTNIETEFYSWSTTSSNNYRQKLLFVSNLPHKYTITLSEDFITSHNIFDFFIENRHILDDPNTIHLTGISQIGVPSCEHFIKDFCTLQEQKYLYKLFLDTDMDFVAKVWNVPEISQLNQYTKNANQWNYSHFHQKLQTLSTELKGIHPVRFNYEAQVTLSEILINNIDKFMGRHEYEIFTDDICHHCNDMSFHLNNTLRTVEKTYPLNPDEEVAFSRYKRKHGLKFKFVKYGYVYTEIFSFCGRYIPKNQLQQKRKEIEQKLIEKIEGYLG